MIAGMDNALLLSLLVSCVVLVIFVQAIIMGTVQECMALRLVELEGIVVGCMALRLVELEGIVVGCMGTVRIEEEVTGGCIQVGCIMEACTVVVLVAQWVVLEGAWVLTVIKTQIIPLVLHHLLQAFGFRFFEL